MSRGVGKLLIGGFVDKVGGKLVVKLLPSSLGIYFTDM